MAKNLEERLKNLYLELDELQESWEQYLKVWPFVTRRETDEYLKLVRELNSKIIMIEKNCKFKFRRVDEKW